MTCSDKNSRPTMSAPADYRIVVQGSLGEAHSRRLGGLNVSVLYDDSGEPATILLGRLRDQAALMGLLNNLYDLHMPIVLIENLNRKCRGGL